MITKDKVTEIFCIIDEFCKHFDGTNNKASNLKWIKKPNRKQILPSVVQLSKEGLPIKVYSSISEASRIMGCSEECITACCNNQNQTVCDSKWQLKSDFDKRNI